MIQQIFCSISPHLYPQHDLFKLPLEAVHFYMEYNYWKYRKTVDELEKAIPFQEGRLTTLKSFLFGLVTYFLFLFLIPSSMAKMINKNFRHFIRKDIHLVSWDKVYKPLSCGRLGVKILFLFNKTLLNK